MAENAVVATDSVSANADYDNGATLEGSPRFLWGGGGHAL